MKKLFTLITLVISALVSNAQICENWNTYDSLTANANSGTPSYSYSWSNAALGQTLASIDTSGTYTVTVTDSNQCYSTSAPTIITVNQTPSAPATPIVPGGGSTTICEPATPSSSVYPRR